MTTPLPPAEDTRPERNQPDIAALAASGDRAAPSSAKPEAEVPAPPSSAKLEAAVPSAPTLPAVVRPPLRARVSEYARGFTETTANARLLLFGTACLWVSIGIFGVLFNLYLITLGYSVAFLGLLAAVSTVGQAAASPLLSRLLRKWPARKLMLAAMVLAAFTMAASAVFTYAALLIVAIVLQGVAVSAASIPSSLLIMEQSTVSRRTHLFSAYSAASSLGSMAGSFLSGIIPAVAALLPALHGHAAQDRVGLLIGAALTILGAWAFLRITDQRVAQSDEGGGPSSMAGPVVDDEQLRGDMLGMITASAFIAVGLGLVYPLLNVYLATDYHATSADIGILYALSGIVCTVSSLFAPAIAGKGKLSGLVVMRAMTAPFLILFFLHPSYMIVAVTYLTRNILGQITGTLENTFAMEVVPANVRASVASWRTFSFNVGWTAGSLVAGVVVARFSFDPIFVASGFLTLAGACVWYLRFGRSRWLVRFPLHIPGR